MSYTGTANVSLAKIVVQNIIHEDVPTLIGNEVRNNDLLDKILTGSVAIATNATNVNTQGYRFIQLQMNTTSSIASLAGAITGMPFTLIQMINSSNASFVGLATANTNFLLSGDWNPASLGHLKKNITLVWDGTNYVEISRVA
jgi:hypothetical protein